MSVTFAAIEHSGPPRYDLGALATTWERRLVEKATSFGGVLLQRSPALLLVAFGILRAPGQLPDRAVQAAVTIRRLVAREAAAAPHKPCPEVRLAMHAGIVLLDVLAPESTTRVLSVGETLTLPIHLLGHAAPMELLLSSQVGRLVENRYVLEERALPLFCGAEGQHTAYAVCNGISGRQANPSSQADVAPGRGLTC